MPNLPQKLSLFVSEFKRRKVSRLISVYAVVGCGIIGTVDIIGGRFLFPDWLVRSIIGMVIGGFPVALILEWIFEKTPTGIKKTKGLTEDEKAAVPQAKFRLNWVSIIVLSITLFFSFAFFTIPRPNMVGFEGKDRILITDLENNTSDSIFDLSLKQALVITIDQSKHVSVCTKRQIENVLKRMQLPIDTKIDTKLGLEIAEREHVKAVLSLSISNLGSSYIISTRILNPYSGEAVISRQTTAEGKDDILEALNRLARRLRKDLGESILSMNSNKVSLQKATTHSLEALRNQSLGSDARANLRTDEAELFLLQAIALDPEFALAHEELGTLYYWKNDREKGDFHYDTALSLLDRLTEKEKLFIQAKVEEIRGNRLEAIYKWKNFLKRYPNSESWFRIGYNYFMLNRNKEAIEAFNESLKYNTNKDPATFINIASCYSQLKMYKESIKNYRKAFELKPDWMLSGNLNHEFGFTYVQSGQIDKGAQVFEKMIEGSEEQQARGYRSLALLKMRRGEYNSAIDLLNKSSNLFETLGYHLSQFRNRTFLAVIYKEKGMPDEFKTELEIANNLLLSTSSGPGWFTYLGKLYVRCEKLEEADNLMAMLSERVKEGKRDDESAFNQLKGEIELAKGNHAEALNCLKKANLLWNNSYTLESLAHYYLTVDDKDNAICTFEDIIDNYYTLGWEGQQPSIFAYYSLGKLYAEEGNAEQAIEYFNEFLGILDKPDEDLQVIIDARSRLEELISLEKAMPRDIIKG